MIFFFFWETLASFAISRYWERRIAHKNLWLTSWLTITNVQSQKSFTRSHKAYEKEKEKENQGKLSPSCQQVNS